MLGNFLASLESYVTALSGWTTHMWVQLLDINYTDPENTSNANCGQQAKYNQNEKLENANADLRRLGVNREPYMVAMEIKWNKCD